MPKVEWKLFSTLAGLTITIIGAILSGMYKFSSDIKHELKKDMEKFEARMEKFDARMEKLDAEVREDRKEINARWIALFEKFHILDKDLEKFKSFPPH